MSDTDDTDVEDLIDAARSLGTSDPEQEITALQEILRASWNLMTEKQQADLVETDEVQEILNADVEDPDEGEGD